MKHLSLFFSILLTLTSSIGFCQNNNDFRFTSKNGQVTIPFELWNSHIYVKVKINNSDSLHFLFDTGAGSSGIAIDSSVAAAIGLEPTGKITATMTGGKSDLLITDSASLEIGRLMVLKQKAAWFHLKEQEQEEGHKIDGILSYSFFKYFVFEIDYKKRVLTIIAPENYNDKKWKSKTPLIDLDKNRVPIVSGFLITRKGKKIKTEFTVDTGHDEYLLLGKSFVMNNGLNTDTLKRQPTRVNKGLGGETNNKAGYIQAFSLSSITVKNPDVLFSLDKEGNYSAFDGALLGGRFFKSYKLILNYPGKYMVLTKGSTTSQNN